MDLIIYYLKHPAYQLVNKRVFKDYSLAFEHNLWLNYVKLNTAILLQSRELSNNSLLSQLLSPTLASFWEEENKFNLTNFYIFIYQRFYLSKVLQTPVYFKTVNIQSVIPKELLSYMMYSIKSVKWKKFYIIHSNEIVEILFLCLWLKNINLFVNWIRKYFEKINLKKHKKLFLLFKYILGKFIWNYNLFFRLRGIRLILRGKFGKAGSVRKSRKYIKRGRCSYTSKNLALVNRTTIIRTTTGTFSIKLEIFY